jgi:hypothetical protein
VTLLRACGGEPAGAGLWRRALRQETVGGRRLRAGGGEPVAAGRWRRAG